MANIVHYDIGDVWKPQASFTVAGTATDPTTLVVKVKDPSGNVTTTTESSPATLTSASSPVARTTAGTFILSEVLDETGHWYCNFKGTGAAVGAEDFEAIVDPTPFTDDWGLSTRALVTLGQVKDWLNQKNVDTSDDLKIIQTINAASERIMEVAGREFKPNGTNPEERSFDLYRGDMYGIKQVGDLQTISTASTSATLADYTGVLLQTLDLDADVVALPRTRRPWEPITGLRFLPAASSYRHGNVLNITGHWGFPTVPEDIVHACRDTVAYWLDRDVEHFRQDLGAVAGGSEGGQTVIVGTQPTILPLPPEAYMIAKGYRHNLVG